MDHFLHEYASILADPAHTAVEATFTIVVDILFLGIVWPFIRRHFHRDLLEQHQVIDREHGMVSHAMLDNVDDIDLDDLFPPERLFLTNQEVDDIDRPYDYERQGL